MAASLLTEHLTRFSHVRTRNGIPERKRPLLSVICPVHNEEQVLPELYRCTAQVMGELGVDWELVLVDDGSSDASAAQITCLHEMDPRVRGIRFSRNFGFQIAVTAGLDTARGDAVILMDADLQDPPEVIPQMFQQWKKGYDVVYGIRSERDGETWIKKATAGAFYRFIRRLSSVDIPLDTGDFRLMDRRVVEAIRKMPEHHRFLRGMVSWVGFRQIGVCYHRHARYAGETKFTLRKMIRFALDAITSFSTFPLQVASWLGFALAGLSGLAIALLVVLGLTGASSGMLTAAAILAAVLFVGAIQLVCLGIMGEYMGRMVDEMKARPLYLVDRTWGIES
jgi:glycosyltransferase involved in cell wall biosynthesis